MPELSRWFIRTALVFLLVSLLAGVAEQALPSGTLLRWPTYVHLLVVGWLTQLIFGVALWMFPRPRTAIPWSERLGWIAYGSLNAGLVLRAVTESELMTHPRSAWFLTSALLQLVAGWAFVIAVWPRVRGR